MKFELAIKHLCQNQGRVSVKHIDQNRRVNFNFMILISEPIFHLGDTKGFKTSHQIHMKVMDTILKCYPKVVPQGKFLFLLVPPEKKKIKLCPLFQMCLMSCLKAIDTLRWHMGTDNRIHQVQSSAMGLIDVKIYKKSTVLLGQTVFLDKILQERRH